jgi:hypothetical protein
MCVKSKNKIFAFNTDIPIAPSDDKIVLYLVPLCRC